MPKSRLQTKMNIFTDFKRKEMHKLMLNFKGRTALQTLYDHLKLQPLPESMSDLAGIDLWLLTRPFSWRQLAWAFYKCNVSTAVIEVKKVFVEGT